MAFDEDGKINAEQLLIQGSYLPVDNAQVNFWRVAKNEGSQWVVDGSSGKIECIKTIADEIGSHPRGKVTNIVAT